MPAKGVVEFGPFIPVSMAHAFSPYLFIEVPLQRRVTAVVAALPQEDSIVYTMQFLDLTGFEAKSSIKAMPGYPEDALLPEHGLVNDNPPVWLRIALTQAQKFWQPLTSKLAASKIAPLLHTMNTAERNDLLNDNRKSISRTTRENLFICLRWPVWAKFEASFEQCSSDARDHGLHLDPDNIRKRASRLALPTLSEMRE